MYGAQLTLRDSHGPLLYPLFQAFLLDRRASRCTIKTLEHYRYTVGSFVDWLEARRVTFVGEIAPHHIRAYLVSLQDRGLKDTTQHAHARGIKAWLDWLVREEDLDRSPMAKVTMPRLEQRVLPAYAHRDLQALLAQCDRRRSLGARDYAIVLALLDTGLRASEFCSLRIGDIDMRSGICTVLGKGRKARQVRAGSRARAAIMRMLAHGVKVADGAPLWASYNRRGEVRGSLSSWGLRSMLGRLGQRANVRPCCPPPLQADVRAVVFS